MTDIALTLEHSVEADVSPAFAWRCRTDVATWRDPPATFVLDGPFCDGSRGTTLMPGQDPLHWRVRNVLTERSFTIEMPLDRATVCFEWCFDALSGRRTKLTQRIVLTGDNAEAYVRQIQTAFETMPAGMHRIASDLEAAERFEDSAD